MMTLHDNFVCDVCGKRRSLWNRRNLHTKCSKIRQERYGNTGHKHSEEAKLMMSMAAKARPQRPRTEKGTYA